MRYEVKNIKGYYALRKLNKVDEAIETAREFKEIFIDDKIEFLGELATAVKDGFKEMIIGETDKLRAERELEEKFEKLTDEEKEMYARFYRSWKGE